MKTTSEKLKSSLQSTTLRETPFFAVIRAVVQMLPLGKGQGYIYLCHDVISHQVFYNFKTPLTTPRTHIL